jgi:undecaprenyl phosphate N,N'-diacetylbacillosamine 1-phosphate transferase
MYKLFFKRAIDITVSFILLVVTLPFTLVAGILLAFANNGKIFFIQQRPGLHGKPFHIVKFKTMNDKRDAAGNLLPDHVRLTAVGKLVRKTSVDELPQLINVLKGDISLIGPRPLLMEYLPLYSPLQARRHEVRPGITGWAQVNGRNRTTWEKRFAEDLYYVENVSFLLDLKIFFLTIIKILKVEGISGEGTVTMEKFKGNNEVSPLEK